MTTGAIRSAAIRSAAEMPSSTGILTSRMTRSGRRAVSQLHGRLAVAGLGHDLVPLFLQHLLEVQADQRLILGDHDAQQILAHPQRLQ